MHRIDRPRPHRLCLVERQVHHAQLARLLEKGKRPLRIVVEHLHQLVPGHIEEAVGGVEFEAHRTLLHHPLHARKDPAPVFIEGVDAAIEQHPVRGDALQLDPRVEPGNPVAGK